MAGESVIEIVGRLLERRPEISELMVFEPPATPPLQNRLKEGPHVAGILSAGLKIRGELGLPFWDSLLAACFGVGPPAVPILEQASFHNAAPIRATSVPASAWGSQTITGVTRGLTLGNMLVLGSRIKLRTGESRHLPMLDFHLPSTAQNEALAVFIAKSLDPIGGYLLNSGKSYHFYGKSLLAENALPAFLGRALQFCPLVDRAWVAHQLIEGACGLRISEKPGGGPVPQCLIEF